MFFATTRHGSDVLANASELQIKKKTPHMFSLKVASVGGDRLLSSDAAIVPTISGNSFSDTIFWVTKTAHSTGEPYWIPVLVLLWPWVESLRCNLEKRPLYILFKHVGSWHSACSRIMRSPSSFGGQLSLWSMLGLNRFCFARLVCMRFACVWYLKCKQQNLPHLFMQKTNLVKHIR